MYDIIKSVIESGRYELSDMLKKIDTIWIQGDISEEEKTELVDLAREKATPENSFAPLQKQINNLAEKVDSIDARVKALETPEGGGEPTKEYPEYVQPTGAHDAYHNGDGVTFDGEKYDCIAPEGVDVVWSPAEYPAYWQKKVEE